MESEVSWPRPGSHGSARPDCVCSSSHMDSDSSPGPAQASLLLILQGVAGLTSTRKLSPTPQVIAVPLTTPPFRPLRTLKVPAMMCSLYVLRAQGQLSLSVTPVWLEQCPDLRMC